MYNLVCVEYISYAIIVVWWEDIQICNGGKYGVSLGLKSTHGLYSIYADPCFYFLLVLSPCNGGKYSV